LNETLHEVTIPLESSSGVNAQVLSWSRLYHLTLNPSANNKTCKGSKCYASLIFEHIMPSKCLLGVTCPSLQGQPCAEYQIKAVGDESSWNICRQRALYPGQVAARNGSLRFDVWWHQPSSADVSASCYVWCTQRGDMPSPKPQGDVDGATITAVVRGSHTKVEGNDEAFLSI